MSATERSGIRLDRVSHGYATGPTRLVVLDDISFDIAPGEFISLVGPSGCGKTTVLDLMSGLLPLQQGALTVGDRQPEAGRADTARMFARDALLPWRTAYANVEFASATRQRDPVRRDNLIRTLLKDVGLAGFEDAFPRQLSQGMRQRVALARTFSLESPFLFLDEPFGALDAQTKLVLQDMLLSLWERVRSTVVLVSHDLSEAVALSDRVIVMSARPGRIVADVRIDLPRPRSVAKLQTMREFHDLYAELWRKLEQASGAAA